MIEHIGDSDEKFHVNGDCNGCGTCASACPVRNITMKDKTPQWNHSCQQCFACLHWCPQVAIQYGKAPPSRGRYHNPDVALREMLEQQKR
jgi:MinD superfamily P-loop ATPase